MADDVSAPSGTVTFLFTDIEGSTPRWEQSPAAMRAAVAEHDRVMNDGFGKHGGHIFTTAGDSFAVAFASASAAADAASEVLLQLEALGELPDIGRLGVRVGLHTGVAELRNGDYFGPDVNVAARVMGLAAGGQILMTGATAALLAGHHLLDLGEHHLRGLARPRRIHQLLVGGLPREFPPIVSGGQRATNVPEATDVFVGREEEMARVTALLDDHRLVTLVGPGGAGKTRLATEIARPQSHDDGVWFVDLARLPVQAAIEPAIAAAIGLRETPGRPLGDQLVDHLGSRQCLLVLDNCEHVLDDTARFVGGVMAAAPELQVIATSRERLEVRGEVVVDVGPLALPPAGADPEAALAAPAVQLMRTRVAEVIGRDLDAGEAAQIGRICRLVDGLPLAIELAAARLRTMSVDQLADRLQSRLSVLRVERGRDERHRTLEAVIDWSYGLLAPVEQVLFDRLSVFAGGFTPRAATRVLVDDAVEPFDVEDGLDRLLEKSLITVDAIGTERRLRLLETLRSFSAARLDERSDADQVRERHLEWVLEEVAELQASMRTPAQDSALQSVRLEHDNLRAARAFALGRGDEISALRITAAAPVDAHAVRMDRLRDLLTRVGEAEPALRASACYTVAGSAFEGGAYDVGLPYGEEARRLFAELGDDRQRAYAEMMTAYCYWGAGRRDVEGLLRTALATMDQLDDRMGQAYLNMVLAQWRLQTDGQDPELRALSERALHLFEEIDSPFGRAHAEEGRGYVLAHAGELVEATGLVASAIGSFRQQGERGCVAHALDAAATVMVLGERHHEGAELFGAAARIRDDTGVSTRPWEASARDLCRRSLGEALADQELAAAMERGRAEPIDELLGRLGLA